MLDPGYIKLSNTQSLLLGSSQSNGEDRPVKYIVSKGLCQDIFLSQMVDMWLLLLMLFKKCFKYFMLFRKCYFEGMFNIGFLDGRNK